MFRELLVEVLLLEYWASVVGTKMLNAPLFHLTENFLLAAVIVTGGNWQFILANVGRPYVGDVVWGKVGAPKNPLQINSR